MTDGDRKKARRYISKLRNKYDVLWRESPVRPEEEENDFLDGIILAEPPQGLDQEQLEAKGPSNEYIDESDDQYYGRSESDRGGFGFQLYNYGGFLGQ